MPSTNIATKFDVQAEHTYPTLSYGNACSYQGSPYIGNCGFDGAGVSLNWLYGGTMKKGAAVAANLMSFD